MAIKRYPELDDESRNKILEREKEEKRKLSEEETLRILEFLKQSGREISMSKMALLLVFKTERWSQIYLCLKNDKRIKFSYRRGEWFLQYEV